jgi:hypothetical protein
VVVCHGFLRVTHSQKPHEETGGDGNFPSRRPSFGFVYQPRRWRGLLDAAVCERDILGLSPESWTWNGPIPRGWCAGGRRGHLDAFHCLGSHLSLVLRFAALDEGDLLTDLTDLTESQLLVFGCRNQVPPMVWAFSAHRGRCLMSH